MSDWWEKAKEVWVTDYSVNFKKAKKGLEEMKSDQAPKGKYFHEVLAYNLEQFDLLPQKVDKYLEFIAGKLSNLLLSIELYRKNKQ